MPAHWDVARDANTMGVVTQMVIDPTKVTVRIRNKIVKWLEQGFIEGGYSSHARKLCDMLVKKYELEAVGFSWRGIRVHNPSSELAGKLIEILDADWAAYLLESPGTNTYYQGIYNDARRKLGVCQDTFICIHDKDLRRSAGLLISELSNQDRKDRVKQAIDAITGTEPIHMYTYG